MPTPAPSFWSDMGGTLFPAERVAAAAGEVDDLAALLGIDAPLDILDMPCGVGRHSVEWARRGHRVTGVDLTAAYIDRARAHADKAGVADRVRWQVGDMQAFRGGASFDLVTNLWTSFGYGPSRDDDARTARNFFDALRPGGRLVMDLAGKEVVVRRFQAHRWHPREDGVIVLEHATVLGAWEHVEQRWITIVREGDAAATVTDRSFVLRLYSARELLDVLEQAGFVDCTAYGSATGTPYDNHAKRLVVVARKPG
ncbi:MAG: class I SAM-dependent methyltransferase [Phycisphaeraceae bacterium]|nr:class I SAM-dependent methyltransferase [Phycisphaeraceae bacterium]